MQKFVFLGLTILLLVFCCLGSTATEQVIQNHNEDDSLTVEKTASIVPQEEITATLAITKTKTETPTHIVTTEVPENLMDDSNFESSHLPGLDPHQIIKTFTEKYDLDCMGWIYFWEIWSDDCFSKDFSNPFYGLSIASRKKNSVDYLSVGILQEGYPRLDVIYNYFEDVLSLPYTGSSQVIIMNWIKSEINSLDATPGDIREITHNNIPYRLYGSHAFIWLEIGEIEEYIESP